YHLYSTFKAAFIFVVLYSSLFPFSFMCAFTSTPKLELIINLLFKYFSSVPTLGLINNIDLLFPNFAVSLFILLRASLFISSNPFSPT
ncbi:hypothetical protein, partial [Streptobacillus moniliformis]|uniref:hypothetical protein n=1 Tax=Streptobacillus moniliformis TaxID=34105 RepID=UPI001E65B54B